MGVVRAAIDNVLIILINVEAIELVFIKRDLYEADAYA